jgi:hypothetical protein
MIDNFGDDLTPELQKSWDQLKQEAALWEEVETFKQKLSCINFAVRILSNPNATPEEIEQLTLEHASDSERQLLQSHLDEMSYPLAAFHLIENNPLFFPSNMLQLPPVLVANYSAAMMNMQSEVTLRLLPLLESEDPRRCLQSGVA